MSRAIGGESNGFGHHESFRVDGKQVEFVVGQGQVHFFFARGTDVYWLGIDARLARGALAQLLDVEVEEVLTLKTLLGVSGS